jgi:bifunctional non-homologous end joining protein LigD
VRSRARPGTIDYFAFDLLELDGEDLTGLPLVERKAKLREILPEGNPRCAIPIISSAMARSCSRSFCAADLEGVISKRADARYVGSRSGGWLKTKCIKRQEFVVVGWTPSDKSRLFRSLILGVHEKAALRYAGKVGTGFEYRRDLRLMETMKPLEQKEAAR